jgi:hypothetical protein
VSQTQVEDIDVRPTDGWNSYSFTYSANGYSPQWGGACTGSGACTIVNDQPSSSLTVAPRDSQPPTITFNPPSRVGPNTTLVASATDNDSVARYEWDLCSSSGTGCSVIASGPSATSVRVFSRPSGAYQLRVWAWDASGNARVVTANITYVSGVVMTWYTVPPYTEAPSFAFHSDDEDHIVARQCRAYPTGGTPGDWGPCTTPTSYAPQLADGRWTLQAEEVDDLGLVGLVSQNTVVDTTAPAVAFTDGPTEGGTVSTENVEFHFAATDDNLKSVTCALDDAAPVACDSSYLLAGYHDGAHTFTVTATDELGHTASAVRHFTVEVPPALGVDGGPADGATVSTTSVKYLMTVTAGDVTSETCRLDSRAAVPCTGSFTVSGYGNGTHTVTFTVGDAAGMTATVVRHFTAKVPTTLAPKAAKVTVTYGQRVTVTATVTPAGATGTVRFRVGSSLALCSATVRSGVATCSATLWSLTAGTHTVTASYSGTYSPSTSHFTLVVKRAATAVRVRMASTIRHGKRLTVTATHLPARASGWVTVSRSGHRLCSAKVSKGSAHCSFVASLRPGRYTITVRYGGNQNYLASSKSVRLTVTR